MQNFLNGTLGIRNVPEAVVDLYVDLHDVPIQLGALEDIFMLGFSFFDSLCTV